MLWTAADQWDTAPTDPQKVSFIWVPTGNVDDVQEVNGTAYAEVKYTISAQNWFNRYYPVAKQKQKQKQKQNSVTTGISVNT
jgi:hypothetical protein